MFIAIFTLGCKSNQKVKEVVKPATEQEIREDRYRYAEMILEYEYEKIQLLSIIHNINTDTVYQVLKEYLANNPDFVKFGEAEKEKYDNLFSEISKKFKISRRRIATLVFSYKYETLTKDEIEEAAIEGAKEDMQVEYEYEEDYDPRR
jgi:hypothetical protein